MKKTKYILTLFALGVTLVTTGQNLKDTVFIYKDSVFGTSQSIYYDIRTNNISDKDESYFLLYQSDEESYNYSLDYLKESKQNLIKRNPKIPWTSWLQLKQYNGKLYIYKPCDYINSYGITINDSTFIDWGGEGPTGSKILNETRIDFNTYKFKLTGISEENRQLTVHIVDSITGIAVFEEKAGRNKKKFYLMTPTIKRFNFPLIVNNCRYQKQTELEFEEPNYIKILRKRK